MSDLRCLVYASRGTVRLLRFSVMSITDKPTAASSDEGILKFIHLYTIKANINVTNGDHINLDYKKADCPCL